LSGFWLAFFIKSVALATAIFLYPTKRKSRFTGDFVGLSNQLLLYLSGFCLLVLRYAILCLKYPNRQVRIFFVWYSSYLFFNFYFFFALGFFWNKK